jgi:tRNA dimethylallyltransferase
MNIFIIGPTASGKSSIALALAQKLNCPIISADARQCYRFMDIGTAKPSDNDLRIATHYNVSILDPSEKDDAASFVNRVHQWQQTHPQKYWIISGGSTLYVQSLLFPLDDIPKSDPIIQTEVELLIKNEGLQAAFKVLQDLDPVYATKMDGLNQQRITRALVICKQTGKPFSSFHQRDQFEAPDNTLIFGVFRDRKNVVHRIEKRVDDMIESGLVDEVKHILSLGYSSSDYVLKSVGYEEVIDYLNGNLTYSGMIDKIKTHTRQYAKRQMTWFKRWPSVDWINADTMTESQILDHILQRLETVEKHQKMA